MIKFFPFKKLISKNRPFFIYDGAKLTSNIDNVKHTMESILDTQVTLAFSMKTQPNYKIIESIRNRNLSLDVSSVDELNYALSLGFDPCKLFLGGIGLTDQSINLGLKTNIGGIHLNGIELFDQTMASRNSLKITTKLSIRFHPEYLKGSKIGETKAALIKKFANSKILDGLHVYVGRESFEQSTVQPIFSDIEDLQRAGVFQDDWVLYFGPGLPDLDQSPPNMFKIKHNISQIKIEAGRSIVSSCGYYAAPVLSVKQFVPERKTVVIDGGLQHFGSPWVSLRQGPAQMQGSFCDKNGKLKRGKKEVAAIYGSLCLWHDCLHPSFSVPMDIKRGDWVLVPYMGAYGLTAGVPLFIGETLPLEFYFDGSQFLNVTHNGFGETADE